MGRVEISTGDSTRLGPPSRMLQWLPTALLRHLSALHRMMAGRQLGLPQHRGTAACGTSVAKICSRAAQFLMAAFPSSNGPAVFVTAHISYTLCINETQSIEEPLSTMNPLSTL